jgi:colicin import membrane protein
MWKLASRRGAAGFAAAIFLFTAGPALANDDSAGHAIADKFSGAAGAAAKAGARRAAEEKAKTEALRKTEAQKARAAERARKAVEAKANAQARAAEAERLRREAAARAAAEHKAAVERAAAEEAARAAAQRAAERVRAEEAEMLARARAEAERTEARRKLEQEWAEAARQRAEAEASARAEKARAETEQAEKSRREADDDARRAEERKVREAEERRGMEAEREAEARRLAEKHNRLREERELGAPRSGIGAEPHTVERQDPPWARTAPREERREGRGLTERRPFPFRDALAGRATVLLVMEPGRRGIRRFDHSAEPVLCTGPVCYISTGPGHIATPMPRMTALGPANTFGRRAGACRHTLGCVFRRVEIGEAGARLEPVDLRVMRHDRREPREARPDHTCEVVAGRLYCSEPARAGSWRAWIVPEDVAREAGPALLEAAVKAGLPDARAASRW